MGHVPVETSLHGAATVETVEKVDRKVKIGEDPAFATVGFRDGPPVPRSTSFSREGILAGFAG